MKCAQTKEAEEVGKKIKVTTLFEELIKMGDKLIRKFFITDQAKRVTKVGCWFGMGFVYIVICVLYDVQYNIR